MWRTGRKEWNGQTDGRTDRQTGGVAISPVPGPTARREIKSDLYNTCVYHFVYLRWWNPVQCIIDQFNAPLGYLGTSLYTDCTVGALLRYALTHVIVHANCKHVRCTSWHVHINDNSFESDKSHRYYMTLKCVLLIIMSSSNLLFFHRYLIFDFKLEPLKCCLIDTCLMILILTYKTKQGNSVAWYLRQHVQKQTHPPLSTPTLISISLFSLIYHYKKTPPPTPQQKFFQTMLQ